jgi:PAS domain-containing protein
LLKELPGAVYRCRNDADWTVEFISDGCLALTGYRADELTGSRVTSLGALMHPGDAAAVWEKCQASLAAPTLQQRIPHPPPHRRNPLGLGSGAWRLLARRRAAAHRGAAHGHHPAQAG